MKMKVVLSTILCMFLLQSSYGFVEVKKERGGTNGYNHVKETHDAGDIHHLSCTDPGNSACAWDIQPPARVTTVNTYEVDDIVLEVESYIALGQFAGTYLIDGELEVSWTASSFDTYEILIGTEDI